MALLWIDGFDELPDENVASYLPTAGYLGTVAPSVAQGRGETGKCLSLPNTGKLFKIIPVKNTGQTLIVGFGFRYTGSLGDVDLLTLNTASGSEVVVRRGTSNEIIVEVDGTDTLTTAQEVIQGNVWAYFEFKFVWTATTSFDHVTIRVNNVEVLAGSAPALNGTAPDRVVLVNTAAGDHHFDDLYIADATTIANTDFLGDIYVENAYIEGNAETVEFTPMGSVSNYLNINDLGVAIESRFNASDQIGARDIFRLRDLNVISDQLFAVQVGIRVRKVGSGELSITSLVLLDGDETVSAPGFPDASYQTFYNLLNLDPAGALWTVSAFNNIRVGYELTY